MEPDSPLLLQNRKGSSSAEIPADPKNEKKHRRRLSHLEYLNQKEQEKQAKEQEREQEGKKPPTQSISIPNAPIPNPTHQVSSSAPAQMSINMSSSEPETTPKIPETVRSHFSSPFTKMPVQTNKIPKTLLNFLNEMKDPHKGVPLQNVDDQVSPTLTQTHHNCFSGRNAVDWFIKYRDLDDDETSRTTAVYSFNKMMKFGLIVHVTNSVQTFIDGKVYYRFKY